jgi:MFS family permease
MSLVRRPKHFFHYLLHRKVDEVYYSIGLRKLGIHLVGLYEPIFLYLVFNNSLSKVFFFFAVIRLGHVLFIPLGARFMKRFGIKRNMLLSIPFLIIYYLILYGTESIPWLIFIAPMAAVIYRILFFPAYHVDFAQLSSRRKRGKQLGIMSVITIASSVAGPFLGALILTKYGFHYLFIAVSFVFLLSAIPLLLTYDKKLIYRDSYSKAWKLLFKKSWRQKTFSLAFYGVDWAVTLVVWPLFLYILAIDFNQLGVITSISLLFSLLITIYVSRLTDRSERIKLFRFGCVLAALGNFLKMIIRSTFSAIAVQSFFLIGDTLDTTPLTAHIYDVTQKEKIHVGRFIIFREMAHHIGSTVMFFSSGIIFLFVEEGAISYFFPLAGIALLAAGYLAKSFEKKFLKNLQQFKQAFISHVNLQVNKKN